jgi:hypothetical protein
MITPRQPEDGHPPSHNQVYCAERILNPTAGLFQAAFVRELRGPFQLMTYNRRKRSGLTMVSEVPMTGIVFFKTQKLEVLTEFYTREVGAELWMDQGDCRILRHGRFLFGFCQREESETCGILTFVYSDRDGVDRMYARFRDSALDAPRENPRYPIYNFFARDPEERLIEFQMFTGEVDVG